MTLIIKTFENKLLSHNPNSVKHSNFQNLNKKKLSKDKLTQEFRPMDII